MEELPSWNALERMFYPPKRAGFYCLTGSFARTWGKTWSEAGRAPGQLLSPGQGLLIRNSAMTFGAFIGEAPAGAQSAAGELWANTGEAAELCTDSQSTARDEHPSPVTPSGLPWQEENAANPSPARSPHAHAGYWEISTGKGSQTQTHSQKLFSPQG